MKKRQKNPKLNRNLVIAIALVTAISLPIALYAVARPVDYSPKAYIQDEAKALGKEPNSPPNLNGSSFTTINCEVDKSCQHTFEGSDSNLYDTLELTVDFLPPNLSLETCTTSQTMIGNKKITCNLGGTTNRKGTYKLLASLSDGTNPPVTKTLTLNVD